MGVPLTSYTLLKFLAEEKEENKSISSFEMEYTLDALQDYSIFAFVVHDPVEHKQFHDYFTSIFKNLHYSSGENLVFFGLVDSPEKYVLTGQSPFYKDIRESIDMYESSTNIERHSYSAFTIANNLDIRPEQLPAIIVTHDPRLNDYRLYKTCPEKLEVQFNRLTAVSTQMALYKQNEMYSLEKKQNILHELLDEQEIDLCHGMTSINLDDSLAKGLSDIMSFLIEEHLVDRDMQRMTKSQQTKSLEKLNISLRNLKTVLKEVEINDTEYHSLFPKIEKLSLKLANYFSLLIQKDTAGVDRKNYLSINKSWLENNSYNLLQTGLNVEDFLNHEKANDFSASAICLAKMFEQEINLSLVHWIRKQHSIDLPAFFNKYQPGIEAYVQLNSLKVNFNNRKAGSWIAPELGKTKGIFKNNLSVDNWKSIGVTQSRYFLRNWDDIHRVRNKAAHTQLVTSKDLALLKGCLSNLVKNNNFEQLSILKNSYKQTP